MSEIAALETIKIIFENQDFVVCDKPANVLSVPDRFKSDRPCLGLELQNQKKIQIYPVHRLDFEVSGLIMFAKNANAHKASQNWFQEKIIQKKYKALTLSQDFSHWPESIPAAREKLSLNIGDVFNWKMKITRGKKRSFESPHGDIAETKAVFCRKYLNFLEWDMYPITGRAHQLRLELSRHGFPILGDQLYGSKYLATGSWPYGSVALRAVQITLSSQALQYGLPLEMNADYALN